MAEEKKDLDLIDGTRRVTIFNVRQAIKQVQQAQESLSARWEEIRKKEEELKAKEAELQKREAETEKTDAQLRGKAAELDSKEYYMAKAQTESARKQAELARKEKELEEEAKRLEPYKTEEQIEVLEGKLAEAQEKYGPYEELESKIAEADRRSEALDAQAKRQTETAEQQAETAKQQAETAKEQEQTAQHQAEFAESEAVITRIGEGREEELSEEDKMETAKKTKWFEDQLREITSALTVDLREFDRVAKSTGADFTEDKIDRTLEAKAKILGLLSLQIEKDGTLKNRELLGVYRQKISEELSRGLDLASKTGAPRRGGKIEDRMVETYVTTVLDGIGIKGIARGAFSEYDIDRIDKKLEVYKKAIEEDIKGRKFGINARSMYDYIIKRLEKEVTSAAPEKMGTFDQNIRLDKYVDVDAVAKTADDILGEIEIDGDER